MATDRHGFDVVQGESYLVTGRVVAYDNSDGTVALNLGRDTVHVPSSALSRYDQAHRLPRMETFDDFETIDSDRWDSMTTGTGAEIVAIDADTYGFGTAGYYQGVIELDGGSTGAGGAALIHQNAGLLQPVDGFFMECNLRSTMGANDNQIRFGLCSSIGGAADLPDKGMWLSTTRVSGAQYWTMNWKTDSDTDAEASAHQNNNFTTERMAFVFYPTDDEIHVWEGDQRNTLTSVNPGYSAGADGMWRPFIQVDNAGAGSACRVAVDYVRWGVLEGGYR